MIMKKIFKREIAFLLTICILSSFSSCKGSENNKKDGEASKKEDVITVTDMSGRDVEVPKDTKTNTLASTYGVLTPVFVSLGLTDRAVGIAFKNKAFMKMCDERIGDVGTIGNYNIDQEAMAKANPSVYFCKTGMPQNIEIASRLGIPTVTISAETPEEIIKTYRLVGKVCGVEERAEEIASYIETQLESIRTITAGIKEENKPTALVLGTQPGRVAGDDMLQTYLLEYAGSVPVIKGINDKTNWVDIGTEKVFELNPEYIFVTSSGALDYKVEDLMSDKAWSAVKAVKSGNVYKIPAQKDSWDMPGTGFVLATYFMINKMHPECFSDEQLHKKVDEFYKTMYGKTFDGEAIGY